MTISDAEPLETAAEKSTGFDLSRRVLPLDGLRGVAILAVFMYHYGRSAAHSSIAAVRILSGFFGFGWSGVDLFFVLSGFLITGILYDTAADPGYYKKFYARRVLRIFPIYYITMAVIFAVGARAGVSWMPGHVSFLFYLGYPAALLWPSLVQLSPFMPITHLWSLSVEEQFYLIWPWATRRLASGRNILLASLMMFMVAFASRVVFVGHGYVGWAYAFLPCRMDTLAIGAALAIVLRKVGAARLQGPAAAVFLVTTCSLITICVLRHSVDRSDPTMAVWGYSLTAVGYGSLLVLSMGVLSGVFSFSILRMFGRYSYGIYLYHFPLTAVLEPLKPIIIGRLNSLSMGSAVYLAACLGINLLVAALSFRFIESPILGLKSRFQYVDARTQEESTAVQYAN
jgi:peptidoglycan/LPS O-acetylase OafA/YrhL